MQALFTNFATMWKASGVMFEPVRVVTAASDPITGNDLGSHVIYDRTTAVSVFLPAPDAGPVQSQYFNAGVPKPFNGWYCWVRNDNKGTVTFTPASGLIGGSASFALLTGQAAKIVSDGTGYRVFR